MSGKYICRIAIAMALSLCLGFHSSGFATAITEDDQKAIIYDTNYYDATDYSAIACGANTGDITSPVVGGSLPEFVDAYLQSAYNIGQQYGIPYEAILAQAALESGYGKSLLTRRANNFFGIKAGEGWTGPVYESRTAEQRPDGSVYYVTAKFRAYATPEDGFRGYAQFITGSERYKPALAFPGDPVKYIAAVKDAGYATDVSYVQKVSAIIDGVTNYIKSKHPTFKPSSQLSPPMGTPPNTSTDSACNETPDGASANAAEVIKIAEAELAKSPVEYDANVLKYTNGRREAWCAHFVSWVFREAGSPFSGGSAGGWSYPAVVGLQAYYKSGRDNTEYFEVGTKAPQPGDVAFYIGAQTPDGGSTRHVNIVVAVNGNTMTTIGGNESNRVKKDTRQIALGAESLVGFGRKN